MESGTVLGGRYEIQGVAPGDPDPARFTAFDRQLHRRVEIVLGSELHGSTRAALGRVLDGGTHDGRRYTVIESAVPFTLDATDATTVIQFGLPESASYLSPLQSPSTEPELARSEPDGAYSFDATVSLPGFPADATLRMPQPVDPGGERAPTDDPAPGTWAPGASQAGPGFPPDPSLSSSPPWWLSGAPAGPAAPALPVGPPRRSHAARTAGLMVFAFLLGVGGVTIVGVLSSPATPPNRDDQRGSAEQGVRPDRSITVSTAVPTTVTSLAPTTTMPPPPSTTRASRRAPRTTTSRPPTTSTRSTRRGSRSDDESSSTTEGSTSTSRSTDPDPDPGTNGADQSTTTESSVVGDG